MPFLSPRNPAPSVLIAQAIGITASGYMLGQNASLSLAALPALMQAPSPLLARQWWTLLNASGNIARPLGLISGLALTYATYHTHPRGGLAFRLNLVATLVLQAVIPITLVWLLPLNKKIEERMGELNRVDPKALEVRGEREVLGIQGEGESTHALVDWWGVLNLGRAVPIAVGFGCAVAGAVVG
ncbi:hypothetical protein E8E13_000980 [Curvularia kusanoi]|uniref:DUF1772-domain-containing protein n=1 Tax=Curvularia kusanoi TaxID=90978 RepID=A0A9P4W6B9_CURKU|nr:hypothetical protein E8E13_000980 [Curvularia kusanoi]